jgi:hypothetical protein
MEVLGQFKFALDDPAANYSRRPGGHSW